MFNNPLESFHETVAEAKADREQIDRLLTIKTLGERLLFASVLLVLVVLTVWIVFGVVDRNVVAKGTLSEHPMTYDRDAQIMKLDVWLSAKMAREVKIGMPVVIKPQADQVGFEPILGDIQSIQSVNLSKDLIDAGQASFVTRRIEITVEPDVEVTPHLDDELLVIIRLGEQSPLELIGATLL